MFRRRSQCQWLAVGRKQVPEQLLATADSISATKAQKHIQDTRKTRKEQQQGKEKRENAISCILTAPASQQASGVLLEAGLRQKAFI